MAKDMIEARREAEAARARLADTAEALVYKLNAPKRLKERVATKVRTAKEQASARVGNSGG
jgi:hypothetical protein